MESLIHLSALPHTLTALVYLTQAVASGASFRACLKHGHPTHHNYLASCIIYVVLSGISVASIV